MEHGPLVSIGILSYNRPDDLRRAVNSVLAQSYRNLEIIISDNGSHVAECAEVIMDYAANDARIRPFCHKENRGVHFNLKFVTTEATGEYFCWLAGDDAFSPDYILDSLALISQNTQIIAAGCMPQIMETGAPVAFQYLPDTVGLPVVEKYLLITSHVFNDRNLFYYGLIRREALLQCSLHFKKLYGSDLLLLFELLAFGDIAVNRDKPGYIYQVHEGQISATPTRYRQLLISKEASLVERRAFFSAYIGYMMQIVWRRKGLSIGERQRIIRKIAATFISSHRYHMLKYDLGINGLIQSIKRIIKAK